LYSSRSLIVGDFNSSNPNQRFTIRHTDTDGFYQIYNEMYSNNAISLQGYDCSSPSIVLLHDNGLSYQMWKTNGKGLIENAHCKGFVIDISDAGALQLVEMSNAPSQKWDFKSPDAVLSPATGTNDNSEMNSNQTWNLFFADVGYDYGLFPGFPGSEVTVDAKQCLSSTLDQHLAKNAMRTCDESMEFLVGPELSVGTLKAIANSVSKDGPSRMPGYCCMVRFELFVKNSGGSDSIYEISTP
jgi:hypothetical protein